MDNGDALEGQVSELQSVAAFSITHPLSGFKVCFLRVKGKHPVLILLIDRETRTQKETDTFFIQPREMSQCDSSKHCTCDCEREILTSVTSQP